MPYITEEIWHQIKHLAGIQGKSIMLQPYPLADESKISLEAENDLEWIKSFILGIRRIRSEMDIKQKQQLPVLLANWNTDDQLRFNNNMSFINRLANIESIEWLDSDLDAPESATALAGEMKILIPLAGLIDKEAEKVRLEKEISKIQDNLDKTESRLNNPSFTEKAPENVVAQVREQAEAQRMSLDQLQEQLDKIKAL